MRGTGGLVDQVIPVMPRQGSPVGAPRRYVSGRSTAIIAPGNARISWRFYAAATVFGSSLSTTVRREGVARRSEAGSAARPIGRLVALPKVFLHTLTRTNAC